MRIAMISEHANPLAVLGGVDAGGQNLHVAELSKALAADGHDVTVYTRQNAPDQDRFVTTPQGYRVVHVPAGPPRSVPRDEQLPHMAAFTEFVDDHWRTEKPDVVHSHFWMSGLVAAVAAKRHGVPMTHTYHALGTVKRRYQGKVDTSPPSRIATERLVGRNADRIIAMCADEVTELSMMGLSKKRIEIVPSGVDCARFVPDGPRPAKKLEHRLVSVGRLVPRKGFAELIAVLPSLPDTELVIAAGPARARMADDPEAKRLRELAKRLGVAGRVRLAGQVPRNRMPELLRSADVVACVPWYEPFGIVPLEAMACGVPVLASSVGGLTDTVVDGVTGVLVPPRRRASLAAALKSLLGDPIKRTFMGAAGRDRVESRYPWSVIAAQTARIYESCLETAQLAGSRG
ncbi:glycosyltransferase [Actinophytocola sp.]|uniref:glycosyltransferase n=1 Tax=Actinophytocola sp. TaxID=1872138 RepID=UPI002ED430CA